MKTHNVHEQAVNVYSNVYLDNKIKRSNKKQVKTNVSKFVCWLFAWIAAFAKGGLWLGWILPCGVIILVAALVTVCGEMHDSLNFMLMVLQIFIINEESEQQVHASHQLQHQQAQCWLPEQHWWQCVPGAQVVSICPSIHQPFYHCHCQSILVFYLTAWGSCIVLSSRPDCWMISCYLVQKCMSLTPSSDQCSSVHGTPTSHN